MPLEDHGHAVRVQARARVRAAEPGDLEEGRDGVRAQLVVELQHRAVRRRLRAERLVVHGVHRLGDELVLPPVD